MSKHNNNLNPCMDAKCKCGRYISIGESKARGYIIGNYVCPDCTYHENKKRYESIGKNNT